jgi:hypothetical protein
MVMKNEKMIVNEELIGKYINQVLWSDVNPVGKIIAIKGKTKVLIQPICASQNKAKMEYVTGGFAGVCINQNEQHYDYMELGEVFETTLSHAKLKKAFWSIGDAPYKQYDYNF